MIRYLRALWYVSRVTLLLTAVAIVAIPFVAREVAKERK